MISFENVSVMNFEGAFRGMRNPMNSWDKSDSFICHDNGDDSECVGCPKFNSCSGDKPGDRFIIGENDLKLAQNLIKGGSDHRKFMRQIFVSVDITAPLYWWKEFDTYKVGTVENSCSTMHTIHKRDLTLDDFSHEHLTIEGEDYLNKLIEYINFCRHIYLDNNDKDEWYQMIQLLPSSYNQMRTVTMNYENLRNIYKSRQNHKLDEWRVGFMVFIDSLPYADELIKYD